MFSVCQFNVVFFFIYQINFFDSFMVAHVETVYLFLYWHDLLMYCIAVSMSKIVHLSMTTVANPSVMLSQPFNIRLRWKIRKTQYGAAQSNKTQSKRLQYLKRYLINTKIKVRDRGQVSMSTYFLKSRYITTDFWNLTFSYNHVACILLSVFNSDWLW